VPSHARGEKFCLFPAANSASSKQKQKHHHSGNPILSEFGSWFWSTWLRKLPGIKTSTCGTPYWEEGHCLLSFDTARNLVGRIQQTDDTLRAAPLSTCWTSASLSLRAKQHKHLPAGCAMILTLEEKPGEEERGKQRPEK